MAKSLFDEIGMEQVEKLLADATREAIGKAHAAGLPVMCVVNGVTSRIYPDGRTEAVRQARELDRQRA